MINKLALEKIWWAGVERVGGHQAVSSALQQISDLQVDGIIAVGKAATPMLEAALSKVGFETQSLLITKYDHMVCHHPFNQKSLDDYQNDGTLQIIECAHPVPDQNSLQAGEKLVEFVSAMAEESHLLVLISGGASALAEKLPDNMTLPEFQNLTQQLLADGWDIGRINAKRKEISQIKGGKLLTNFKGGKITVLAISDVEGDSIQTIGSGLGQVDKVHQEVETLVALVATNAIARQACVARAKLLGFEAFDAGELLYGDVNKVCETIMDKLDDLPPGIHIFGGEPTVILPPNPGKGGRNQHLALLLSQALAGREDIEFLVAGSDGTDGPTDAAGGFGNGESFALLPEGPEAIEQADGYNFLKNTDNLFVTGPTGTNVMDLLVLLKS